MGTYDNKAIGERLKIAREHAGFDSAAEAARALQMAYPTYASHENGSRGVVRALPVYARRFNVSIDWLLRGKGPAPGAEAHSKGPEAQLRSALLAFGVDRLDLDLVISLISNFVERADAKKPEHIDPLGQQPRANRRREGAPS